MFRLFVGMLLFAATLFHGKNFENNKFDNQTRFEQSKEVSTK